MEEMETDGDEEMLMMSKQPSMTMLNEREVSAGAARTRRAQLGSRTGRISVIRACRCLPQVLRQAGRATIQKFLHSHMCFDVMRPSGKVGG